MVKKFSLKELVDDTYRYQPPEVRDNAIVFVETKEGGMQIVDAHRDIITAEGTEYEALLLRPYQALTKEQGAKILDVPDKCSKCGSDDIQCCELPEFDYGNCVSVGMQCLDCGHKFKLYFELTEIEDDNDA